MSRGIFLTFLVFYDIIKLSHDQFIREGVLLMNVMNGEKVFCMSSDEYWPPSEKPLIIREIGDYELRFYFNPGKYNAEEIEIRSLMTRISLRVGGASADLSRIRFGEIVVKLNPLISGEEDRRFIKQLFLSYFDDLSPVTL